MELDAYLRGFVERGCKARRYYAHGHDFDSACANTFETHIQRTTPIGVFPGGETPEGFVDMTGNTWDWTSSIYRPYPYDAADGREDPESRDGRRALRGGSWSSGLDLARTSFRGHGDPGLRDDVMGIRLVEAALISP